MIKLELPDEMIAVIGKALGEQPYKLVALTIAEIQSQVTAQQAPPQTAEQKTDEPKKD